MNFPITDKLFAAARARYRASPLPAFFGWWAGELRALGRRAHPLPVGVGEAVGDVVGGGAGEHHRILGHHADAVAQGHRVQFGQGHASDENAAGPGIVEAQQQLEDGALAGPGGSHQGHGLAGPDPECQVGQDRLPRPYRVGEIHLLEGHRQRAFR